MISKCLHIRIRDPEANALSAVSSLPPPSPPLSLSFSSPFRTHELHPAPHPRARTICCCRFCFRALGFRHSPSSSLSRGLLAVLFSVCFARFVSFRLFCFLSGSHALFCSVSHASPSSLRCSPLACSMLGDRHYALPPFRPPSLSPCMLAAHPRCSSSSSRVSCPALRSGAAFPPPLALCRRLHLAFPRLSHISPHIYNTFRFQFSKRCVWNVDV